MSVATEPEMETRHRGGKWIQDWRPEDPDFWARTGRRIANRNLWFSVFAEHIGFSLWSIYSVVVVALPAAGFHFTTDQLFWLVVTPNLVGAALRLPYTFAVPKFGGRNWTAFSAAVLIIPCLLLTWCVTTHQGYGMFVFAALTAGLGGGNFASSMANISFFFPESRKGTALGLNAAGGNLGVAAVQLAIPLVIAFGTGMHLAYAGLFYLPFLVISAVCALFFMDNLAQAKSDFGAQVASAKRGQTWIMSVLYIGTFGSFIGFSGALPLLIKTQFPHVHGAYFAWIGAFVGSLSRPLGGWLADRFGGSRVTLWNFLAMGVAAALVIVGEQNGNFPLFFGAFVGLFVTAGLGNGSTYRMIPAIFAANAGQYAGDGAEEGAARLQAKREAAAAIGIIGAIGAFGGFFVNRAFATSIAATKVADGAFVAFIAFYVLCAAITWWCYLRQSFAVSSAPSLAYAEV